MNPVHASILEHIRRSHADGTSKADKYLIDLPDDDLLRLLFSSLRGRDSKARGMRLSNIGVEVMKHYFKGYTIERPQNSTTSNKDLIYLDQRAALPYFVSHEVIVTFESELGLKLKLAGGDLVILIEIERG